MAGSRWGSAGRARVRPRGRLDAWRGDLGRAEIRARRPRGNATPGPAGCASAQCESSSVQQTGRGGCRHGPPDIPCQAKPRPAAPRPAAPYPVRKAYHTDPARRKRCLRARAGTKRSGSDARDRGRSDSDDAGGAIERRASSSTNPRAFNDGRPMSRCMAFHAIVCDALAVFFPCATPGKRTRLRVRFLVQGCRRRGLPVPSRAVRRRLPAGGDPAVRP